MKKSPEVMAAFAALLRRDGNARAAAHTVGVNLQTIYRWRAMCPHFALSWELALRAFRERRVRALMARGDAEGRPAPMRSTVPRRRNSGHRRKRPKPAASA